jgi:hypothetical protein
VRTAIYLKEMKLENLLVVVDLEVVPRGIYQIDGKMYEYIGQPKFIIDSGDDRNSAELQMVELIVEEYGPNPVRKRPAVSIGPAI